MPCQLKKKTHSVIQQERQTIWLTKFFAKCKLLRTNPFCNYTITMDQAKTIVFQATKFLLSIFQVPTLYLSRDIIGETSNQSHPRPRHGKRTWCHLFQEQCGAPRVRRGMTGGLDGLSGLGVGLWLAKQPGLKDLDVCHSQRQKTMAGCSGTNA